jgi:hypothetical protein
LMVDNAIAFNRNGSSIYRDALALRVSLINPGMFHKAERR